MPLEGQNIQWPTGVPYIVGDRGTGAWGVKDVQGFVPAVLSGTENFETDPISGSGTWTLTASSPHTGLRCLRSAVIGNNGTTDYTFTIPALTTQISFWHRVSTELNFDFFRVYKDAIIPGNLLFQLSGTTNVWAKSTFNVVGATTVTFRFIKDGSSAAGLDATFIDDIEWIITPAIAAVQNYEALHLDNNNCLKTVLCDNTVIVDGEVDTRPLDCLTDSVTICPGDDPIEVTVNNFPIIEHLDCVTDSVTVCPGDDPLEVTVNNFPVNIPLDCLTDSVTICPGDDPIEVTVNNFPANVPLDCATDSVTICPGDDPIEVTVSGTVITDTNFDYPEDSPHVSGDIGAFVLAVRNDDPLNPLTSTNGDYSPIAVTNTGRVFTTDRGNFAEDTPHTSGHFGEFVLGVRNDAGAVLTDSNGDYSPLATDSAGRVGITDLGGSVTVDGIVAVSNPNTQYAEDTAAVSGDLGNLALVMRHDPDTGTVNADGDYSALHVNQFGQLKVTIGGQQIVAVPGKRTLTGLYYATAGPINYTTAADAGNGGDLWLVNTSNSVVVYLRSARFTALLDSLAILTNLPTIRMERMTFTGTPSGTLVTPARRDSNDAANTGTVRTTSTGMTITAGAAIESFSPPTADVIGGLLAVNATASIPVEQLFAADLDSYIALRQNEGIVFRQNTAGNATENRQYWINIVWEEI